MVVGRVVLVDDDTPILSSCLSAGQAQGLRIGALEVDLNYREEGEGHRGTLVKRKESPNHPTSTLE